MVNSIYRIEYVLLTTDTTLGIGSNNNGGLWMMLVVCLDITIAEETMSETHSVPVF
jgi:hypothetical protein